MSLLNIISVPTSNGIKTIEIHNADITNLDFNFDILVLSAFVNGYAPLPGTVIGALKENTGIELKSYASNPLLNFKNSLNCWLTAKFEKQSFNHILCVEGIETSSFSNGNSQEVFENLFGTISLLNYKDMCSSIAMPILGSGNQKHAIDIILPQLIKHAILSLNINSKLQTIFFIEIDESKAAKIDETINKYLNRTKEKLELVFDDSIVVKKLDVILSKLIQIQNKNAQFVQQNSINELIEKIREKNLRFFELGIFGRKLLEFLLADLTKLNKDGYISIFEHINYLKSNNVADWMIAYMHTLRVFGNSVAHNASSDTIPNQMNKNDIIVFCYALDRFLDFYIDFNTNNS